jgi:hypothetical protein
MGVEEVREPEVPVMVIVDVPMAAVLLAVRVSKLEPVVGFVAKLAVTPLGKPVAASVTLPVKPPVGTTEMVLEPWLPCATETLVSNAESV